MIRDSVRQLAEMGPLPSSAEAAEDIVRLEEYGRLLDGLEKPASDEEARLLLRLFGPDECFGLVWSLVHLVESAPGWPEIDMPSVRTEWHDFLEQRVRRR